MPDLLTPGISLETIGAVSTAPSASEDGRPTAIIYGSRLEAIRTLLHIEGEYRVLCFCDADSSMHGTRVAERVVVAPADLSAVSFDRIFIGAPDTYKAVHDLLWYWNVPLDKMDVAPETVLCPPVAVRHNERPHCVIFGAGVAGERTLHSLTTTCEVVAFVDNDPATHGREFLNRPVHPPTALATLDYDCVVVGSTFAGEIANQLGQLGLDGAKVVLPDPAQAPPEVAADPEPTPSAPAGETVRLAEDSPGQPIVDIVIFGTGSNGERAWQAASARSDVRVVCFADNNAGKHGSMIHGRRVIDPAALGREQWDFIVLASMHAATIKEQLIAGGMPATALVTPGVSQYADVLGEIVARKRATAPIAVNDGAIVLGRELPEVLIVTCETLNRTHGTGVLLQRFFGDFDPSKLFSVCHTDTGPPWLENAVVLPTTLDAPHRTEALRRRLQARSFQPRLVYATAFNEDDLELLNVALAVLPQGIPVIQHFMDYMPHDASAFDARFIAMAEQVTDVWALTDRLSLELSARYQRPVTAVTALHQDPPALFKRVHRAVEPGFRAVILGNVWQRQTLPVLRESWRRCRELVPGLDAIDWYVHPMRVQALVDAGCDLGDEIRWRGFYSGAALQDRLQSADFAILPFNADERAEDGYARYSLPSRLTELCGAALPIVALASPDTEPARFLTEHGCGVVATGPDPEAIASVMLSVIRDRELRARLGARARHVAETECVLGPFQRKLLGTFVRLATAGRRLAA